MLMAEGSSVRGGGGVHGNINTLLQEWKKNEKNPINMWWHVMVFHVIVMSVVKLIALSIPSILSSRSRHLKLNLTEGKGKLTGDPTPDRQAVLASKWARFYTELSLVQQRTHCTQRRAELTRPTDAPLQTGTSRCVKTELDRFLAARELWSHHFQQVTALCTGGGWVFVCVFFYLGRGPGTVTWSWVITSWYAPYSFASYYFLKDFDRHV